VKALLRSRGLRATPARVDILAAVESTTVPMSHADVVQRLPPGKHDRTTVFRCLAALVRARLVRRVDIGDHVWRFVREQTRGPRAVFTCTRCGRDIAFEHVGISVEGPDLPQAVYKREIEVRMRGLCNACAEREP
jgi:Fe2+ or Zn2+ uptake regulation protein